MRFATLPVIASLLASAAAFQLCESDTTKGDALKTIGLNNAVTGFSIATDTGLKTYNPNVPVNITIPGTGTFQQILLYAATNRYSANHTGTWINLSSDYTTLDGTDPTSNPAGCAKYGAKATLSSKDSSDKKLPVTFQWLAPAQPTDSAVVFYAMVVKNSQLGYTALMTDNQLDGEVPYPAVVAKKNAAVGLAPASLAAGLVASIASAVLFL
ncbi:hypothetical protein HDU87_002362 [Geranomyces variabilis]|uniref:Reelin domain-containing protein n=1 Tax=Geranomyces variabilis TaxID=109894 RepID=A0AAD5TLM9_9FUNG|nr:hypothetical protein HDU87_002362 [Geranomyces variabilis]